MSENKVVENNEKCGCGKNITRHKYIKKKPITNIKVIKAQIKKKFKLFL